jgi:glutathione S-transferase
VRVLRVRRPAQPPPQPPTTVDTLPSAAAAVRAHTLKTHAACTCPAPAQVLEWLTLCSSQLARAVTDEQLAAISAALASRTFLAGGTRLSLADLVVFGLVHSAVVSVCVCVCVCFGGGGGGSGLLCGACMH